MSIAEKLTQIAENEQKVYDSGYVSGKNKMWDCITANGKREHYCRVFYSTDFTGETFPSDAITPRSCGYMFYDYRGTELPKNIDLSGLTQQNIDSTDGNESSSANRLFCWATHLTKIYDMKLPAMARYYGTFGYLRSCETIEMPMKSRPETQWAYTFSEATGIVNMRIEGVIGQNGFDIHWSTKLSKASITSIINALSTETTGLTVTLSATAVNSAFGGNTSAEWLNLISTKSNWIISLV